MCSEKCQEQFSRVTTPDPAGSMTSASMAAGGAAGLMVGGLALAATALVTGGATLLSYGIVLLGGGSIAGTFIGVMVGRGFDHAMATYYERAVQAGKILVGVEVQGEGNAARLAEAERIFAECGAEPVSLPQQ